MIGYSYQKTDKQKEKQVYIYIDVKTPEILICTNFTKVHIFVKYKENRIFIRGEFRESLGMNFFSPFQPEREFKVYKSCKCSQIICSRIH